MKNTTLAMWALTTLFILGFVYELHNSLTQESTTFLLYTSLFFSFVSLGLTIFDQIEKGKTIRFSKNKGFYTILMLVLIAFSSCTSESARKFKEKEKIADISIAELPTEIELKVMPTQDISFEEIMLQGLYDHGMVGTALTGKLTFLDDKSVEDGYVITFVIWMNNDGGLFLTLDDVPSFEAIQDIAVTFRSEQFEEYLKIDRNGQFVFRALLGSVEDSQIGAVRTALNKLEQISDTKDVKTWKDYTFQPKGKSTITIHD